jgi:hypothetical protein
MAWEADRETIADLEVYGLSVRVINLLEEGLGLIYLDQLEAVGEEDLLACRQIGEREVRKLASALRRRRERRPVKTVDDCVRM